MYEQCKSSAFSNTSTTNHFYTHRNTTHFWFITHTANKWMIVVSAGFSVRLSVPICRMNSWKLKWNIHDIVIERTSEHDRVYILIRSYASYMRFSEPEFEIPSRIPWPDHLLYNINHITCAGCHWLFWLFLLCFHFQPFDWLKLLGCIPLYVIYDDLKYSIFNGIRTWALSVAQSYANIVYRKMSGKWMEPYGGNVFCNIFSKFFAVFYSIWAFPNIVVRITAILLSLKMYWWLQTNGAAHFRDHKEKTLRWC